MDYCPPNATLSGVLHGEVHRCFLDTVTDPFLLVVSLLAGCHQYKLYSTFSTPLDSTNFNSSYLFYLQLFLHGFLPVINILSFITGIFGFISPVHGVDILNIITGTLPWFFTGVLLHMERGRQLPVSPTNGHGPVLLIFWTLAFMLISDFVA
ncbi:ATP-binding cassette sub-family B member 6, mitochondrial [Eurytemora carolleeae]|uniref:ATP-binding cassette sub-family B member 6, mitochondrial n=1 Tax=Eurytemora carolleeae TaxID=1294199 RepID=UPI000C7641A7|nr:ATP-binding cassette sub-family B member 6, mitochondrial [Eurytemora carolleeae]|eukprot:XP_023333270.1 ATP-binding cassette sub-family B member 6, mitochondrial-like [Eurytemora affinis]